MKNSIGPSGGAGTKVKKNENNNVDLISIQTVPCLSTAGIFGKRTNPGPADVCHKISDDRPLQRPRKPWAVDDNANLRGN